MLRASTVRARWAWFSVLLVICASSAFGEGARTQEAKVENGIYIMDIISGKGNLVYEAGVRAFAQDNEPARWNMKAPYVGVVLFDLLLPGKTSPIPMCPEGKQAWDNREIQWWQARKGPLYSPRGRATQQDVSYGGGAWHIWLSYVDDGIKTRLDWTFPSPIDTERESLVCVYYDVTIEVTNVGKELREDYSQLFANYGHKTTHFWTADGELKSNRELGIRVLRTAAVKTDMFANETAFDTAAHGHKASVAFKHPILVSEPRAEGYRHIICCEERTLCFLTSGMGGYAMDYCIAPVGKDLKANDSFTFRARHYFSPLEEDSELDDLRAIWEHFDQRFTKQNKKGSSEPDAGDGR